VYVFGLNFILNWSVENCCISNCPDLLPVKPIPAQSDQIITLNAITMVNFLLMPCPLDPSMLTCYKRVICVVDCAPQYELDDDDAI
jgi:hypothetical protein